MRGLSVCLQFCLLTFREGVVCMCVCVGAVCERDIVCVCLCLHATQLYERPKHECVGVSVFVFLCCHAARCNVLFVCFFTFK